MDHRTGEKLKGLGEESKNIRKGLFKQVDINKFRREALEQTAKDRRLSPVMRDKLKRQLENPEYHKKELQVDSKKAEELNRYYDVKIKKGIRDGTLADPNKIDPQRRRWMEQQRKK